jgi:hypothetical protein
MSELMEIVVDPQAPRRRGREALSGKKKAAALFRVWHSIREQIVEAEKLNDGELVHLLEVLRLHVEERAGELGNVVSLLDEIETNRPN